MGSASLAAARPPTRTVTTIPLQPGGLRGKNLMLTHIHIEFAYGLQQPYEFRIPYH